MEWLWNAAMAFIGWTVVGPIALVFGVIFALAALLGIVLAGAYAIDYYRAAKKKIRGLFSRKL